MPLPLPPPVGWWAGGCGGILAGGLRGRVCSAGLEQVRPHRDSTFSREGFLLEPHEAVSVRVTVLVAAARWTTLAWGRCRLHG